MTKTQFVEGKLIGCQGYACECGCCDDDQVEEWANEYFAFHERMKDHLVAIGINIEFIGDRVKFHQCSNGQECKFLKYPLNKDVDSRPIDCKIYPFVVDWSSIDFDKKIVKLYYWDNECPLARNRTVPDEFRREVETIIKRDFAFLFYGARFQVEFVDEVFKH